MTAWILPVAGAAFWAGLLARSLLVDGMPVGTWLLSGLVALASSLVLVPVEREAPDPLGQAGLVKPDEETGAVAAVMVGSRRASRGSPAAPVLAMLGVFVLGVGWGGAHANKVGGSLLARLATERVTVYGVLRTDPSAQISGWSAVIDAGQVEWQGEAATIHESLWVQGRDRPPPAVRGDRALLEGRILVPEDPEFADALARQAFAAEILVTTFRRLGPSANPFVRAAQSFRSFVGRSIARLFPPREAGLLLGLALGDDSRLDPALARDFQATGLGHLLVVSGENVAMVLGPVLGLALALRLSRVPRFLLASGTVLFFVILTGGESSVMRAGVMAGLTLFGVLLGRPRNAASILAGAVLILLVVDPALVWSIGFQLSVGATAGMVALATPLAGKLRFLPRPVALAAGTSLAAQMGVTPILLFHFHEVPGVTIAANLLAFPAVSPALLLGIAAGGIGLLVMPIGRVLAMAALLPMRYLELVADRLASAPVAWITSNGRILPLAAGVLVCISAWWLRSGRRLPGAALIAGGALVPMLVWVTALSAGPPSHLVIHFFSVGEGDAALVTTPAGASILIDGGPDPEQVATKLSALGVKRLDVAIASHPHADHIAGFPAVFARFPVGLLLEPGCPDPSPIYANLLLAAHEEDIPVRHPRTGDALTVGDVHLEVLSPSGCFTGTESDANNDALVIMIEHGEDRVLFATEPEEPAQQAMLDAEADLGAEVLKVPHHGAATSLPEFFEAADAELAVVSVGPNDYGHPVPSVLSDLRGTGARVLRTDLAGDITVSFDPGGLLVESAA
ncbi:MAG TPA: DNA internalization-related competence protein ComEC/Rec2 [Actinomycetota bacterium]